MKKVYEYQGFLYSKILTLKYHLTGSQNNVHSQNIKKKVITKSTLVKYSHIPISLNILNF